MLSVSIHAPREGCDGMASPRVTRRSCFNSRTPGGVRLALAQQIEAERKFQFTHPGRGATEAEWLYCVVLNVVSIHAPREGCDTVPRGGDQGAIEVSIHAPREGCDVVTHRGECLSNKVSIHAPREGCDGYVLDAFLIVDVSIHAPREGCDRKWSRELERCLKFQFTHPGRGATSYG